MRFSQSPILVVLSACQLVAAQPPSSPTGTFFTLPGPTQPASWFENMVVRPNGRILATRGDAPEIWHINPSTGVGEVIVSLPPSTGAYNLTGISRVHFEPNPCGHVDDTDDPYDTYYDYNEDVETYVFGSSHIPEPLTVTPGSAKVWKLEIDDAGTPTVSHLVSMPSAGFLNGFTEWGKNGRVLISDTEKESVYLLDVATGSYTTPLTNLTGINGIKTFIQKNGDGYLYRADHVSLTFSRIPIDTTTAAALGPAEILANNQLIDDFALEVNKHDGTGVAYLGTMYNNSLVKVTFGAPPSAGLGVRTTFASNLSGTGVGLCTAAAFGRGKNKNKLYATVGQGGDSAKLMAFTI